MWVKNYMFTNVFTVSPNTSISEAVKLMVENKTNSIIVVNKNKNPVGTLSSYTLIKEIVPPYLKDDPIYSQYGAEGTFEKYANKIKNKKVREIMHKDFHSLSEKDAIIEAASYSIEAARRILPVVNKKGELIGAVTRTYLKNALYNVIFKKDKIDPTNGGCGCGRKH